MKSSGWIAIGAHLDEIRVGFVVVVIDGEKVGAGFRVDLALNLVRRKQNWVRPVSKAKQLDLVVSTVVSVFSRP